MNANTYTLSVDQDDAGRLIYLLTASGLFRHLETGRIFKLKRKASLTPKLSANVAKVSLDKKGRIRLTLRHGRGDIPVTDRGEISSFRIGYVEPGQRDQVRQELSASQSTLFLFPITFHKE